MSPQARVRSQTADRSACANCGAAFVPEQRRFCPECGQETRILPPRVMEFLQQLGGAYFSTEGALWRTLKLLFFKPGELTVRYLAGQRKHYVLPLRLYLSASVVLLLAARLAGSHVVSGLDTPELRAREKTALPTLVLNGFDVVSLGVRNDQFVCSGVPAGLCDLIHGRAAPDARLFLSKLRIANERLLSQIGAVIFLLLPAFAACLQLVWRKRRMGYTEHLVFALHLHAFWFCALALAQLGRPLWPVWLWVVLAVMAGYTVLAGHRVYGGSWLERLPRAVALTACYMALLALAVPLAWLTAMLL